LSVKPGAGANVLWVYGQKLPPAKPLPPLLEKEVKGCAAPKVCHYQPR